MARRRGKPLAGRIAVLERRLDHLRRRAHEPGRSDAARDFDLAEIDALGSAIMAMERYRAETRTGISALRLLEDFVAQREGEDTPTVRDAQELLQELRG